MLEITNIKINKARNLARCMNDSVEKSKKLEIHHENENDTTIFLSKRSVRSHLKICLICDRVMHLAMNMAM